MDTASRFSAAIYDPFFWAAERAGLAERRRALVARAHGRVLEIGAGTGLNAAHYADDVDLTLSEPDEAMAAKLRGRLDTLGRRAEVVLAGAEALPFAASSFDTVVSTLVLCSVADPDRAASEIARVLRPEGRLVLFEHVRDPAAGRRAAWQDRLERPWGWIAAGCHPNRRTAATLSAAGFDLAEVEDDRMPRAGFLVSPAIAGTAKRPTG